MVSVSVEEAQKELARRNLLEFAKYTMQGFDVQPFHEVYYTILDKFAKGEVKKLIITMPPQHGKSEGSTRRLPSYLLGINPNLKIAIASYNTTFARKFNRDCQRIIDDKVYHGIFPNTVLNSSNVVTISSSFLRNSEEFEIVGHNGSLKAIGRGGALTGNSVDIMIMDDLYKDYSEGNSPIIRDGVWDWYLSVVKTRLHNDSQELIVFTRWNEDDLVGRLEKIEDVITVDSLDSIHDIPKNSWIKINFEAIKDSEQTEIDARIKGEALWENKHSLFKLERTRELDIENFNCLYQGNPLSKEGMLYGTFKTYNQLPELREIKNYTDTADTGADFLCSICYGLPLDNNDKNIYILDVLYCDDPMELTEQWTAEMLRRNNVGYAEIESNNGGRGFARAIEKLVPPNCAIGWFHQGLNKESRIHTYKAAVESRVIFPSDWHKRWIDFYNHVSTYKKLFKANKQDGIPDVLSGIVEKNDENNFWII